MSAIPRCSQKEPCAGSVAEAPGREARRVARRPALEGEAASPRGGRPPPAVARPGTARSRGEAPGPVRGSDPSRSGAIPKVNDAYGNPVELAAVVVWQVED
ncbi:hypothetical protein, partial [Streptomyces radiopugnans]|uniref:hypothetical protein n=1 Tax=Streptomyces radiopugnans TaxID=403935 RepID=UPI003F1C478C